MNVKLDVRYELGHTLPEEWGSSDLKCPRCGVASVWIEAGGGDYYEGTNHLCVACGSAFTLPRLSDGQDWQNRQRREAILRDANSHPRGDE